MSIVHFTSRMYVLIYATAAVFGDTEIADAILQETKPQKVKAFGRKVKGFDDEVWLKHCKDIVRKGNLAKVRMSPILVSVCI